MTPTVGAKYQSVSVSRHKSSELSSIYYCSIERDTATFLSDNWVNGFGFGLPVKKFLIKAACDIDVLAGYGKTITHVIIGLKTAKGTKQLKLDPSIYESLQKEKVEPGDVIYIEANSGAVKVVMLVFLKVVQNWTVDILID